MAVYATAGAAEPAVDARRHRIHDCLADSLSESNGTHRCAAINIPDKKPLRTCSCPDEHIYCFLGKGRGGGKMTCGIFLWPHTRYWSEIQWRSEAIEKSVLSDDHQESTRTAPAIRVVRRSRPSYQFVAPHRFTIYDSLRVCAPVWTFIRLLERLSRQRQSGRPACDSLIGITSCYRSADWGF